MTNDGHPYHNVGRAQAQMLVADLFSRLYTRITSLQNVLDISTETATKYPPTQWRYGILPKSKAPKGRATPSPKPCEVPPARRWWPIGSGRNKRIEENGAAYLHRLFILYDQKACQTKRGKRISPRNRSLGKNSTAHGRALHTKQNALGSRFL